MDNGAFDYNQRECDFNCRACFIPLIVGHGQDCPQNLYRLPSTLPFLRIPLVRERVKRSAIPRGRAKIKGNGNVTFRKWNSTCGACTLSPAQLPCNAIGFFLSPLWRPQRPLRGDEGASPPRKKSFGGMRAELPRTIHFHALKLRGAEPPPFLQRFRFQG